MTGDATVIYYMTHGQTQCNKLTEHALALGSKDNVSVLSVCIHIS